MNIKFCKAGDKMLKYSEEFMSKKFIAETMKAAYMKAVKWVASNVISKVELKEVLVSYEKTEDEENQLPTIVVHLSAGLSENELRERHCKICKEFHGLFFINENCNCAWCNTKAYQRRTDEMIKTKKNYYKSILMKGE